MRIAFTRIPTPELEEIDPARGRRVRPLKMPAAGYDPDVEPVMDADEPISSASRAGL
jgi:hypothetical protein